MICFNDYLSTDIGGCPSLAGARAQGYLIPRSDVSAISITDGVNVSFTVAAADIIPVFIDMDMPYKLAGEGTRNDYGLTKHNKTIEVFIVENTPLTQKQVMQLQNVPYVFVMFDNNGQKIVVGIERGLQFSSSSQELSSMDTHGGIVVTMTETAANIPMLFGGDVDIVPVTGISTTHSIALSVEQGSDVLDEDISVLPAGTATITAMYAVSENPAIATASVNTKLTVTGVSVGTTTVKVFTLDGNYKLEYSVTVTAAP